VPLTDCVPRAGVVASALLKIRGIILTATEIKTNTKLIIKTSNNWKCLTILGLRCRNNVQFAIGSLYELLLRIRTSNTELSIGSSDDLHLWFKFLRSDNGVDTAIVISVAIRCYMNF